MCVFVTGFTIYGLVGSIEPLIYDSKTKTFLFFGLLGGFGFSMLVSTLILAARFFAKKKLGFKIVAAILWPITFACAIYAGVFMYIPYQIYNLIQIIRNRCAERGTEWVEKETERDEGETHAD